MGLANRLVPEGPRARGGRRRSPTSSRAFPQRCLRSDRLSSYEQWDLPLDAALRHETRLGLDVIRSGETREGARRFASGAGRHGTSE